MSWDMKWGFSPKDIVYIGLIVTGLFFGWRMYVGLTEKVEAQNIAYKQLADNMARASTEFVTKKDLNNFGDKVSKEFGTMSKDIKKLGGEVVAVGQTVAQLEANTQNNQPSDSTATVQLPDGTNTQQDFKKISNAEGLPMAWSKYTIGRKEPWDVGTYKLRFHINTVLGMTEDDRIIPENELIVFNDDIPELKDKPFKLTIVSSQFQQTLPKENKFFLWAPHIDFGLNAGASLLGKGILGPDLGFTIAAYGKTKNDNIWRFGRISVGTRDGWHDPQFTGGVVGYNLGAWLPLISDLWIWPTVSVGFTDIGSYGLGASLSTTF